MTSFEILQHGTSVDLYIKIQALSHAVQPLVASSINLDFSPCTMLGNAHGGEVQGSLIDYFQLHCARLQLDNKRLYLGRWHQMGRGVMRIYSGPSR
jgi:hypothetical protein